MGQSSIGVGGVFHFTFMFLASFSLYDVSTSSGTAKNQFLNIGDLCNNTYRTQYTRMVEGSVVTSHGERNLNCVITFQTDTILQNFMLRFERLQLDCNDHLLIYDGAHTTGTHKADLSCRNTLQNVGTMFTHSNYVTLKYVTDQWGPETNGFRLLITAFKGEKITCTTHFRCRKTNFCVHNALTCDGVNHCGDRSDESPSLAKCPSAPLRDLLGYPGMLLVVVILSSVLVFCVCGIATVICICRWKRNRNLQLAQQQQAAYQRDYAMNAGTNYGANGIGFSHVTSVPQHQQHTIVVPPGSNSGNPGRPAYGVGCSTPPQPTPPTGLSWRQVG